jgi:hypothetical protein
MSRPSYALATRTKDKLGVVGQLVDGATSIVVTATCRPRDWFIFIDGTQFDVRSSAQSGPTLARNASVANDPKRKSRPQANRFSLLNTPMMIAFVSDVALPSTSIIEEAPEHP